MSLKFFVGNMTLRSVLPVKTVASGSQPALWFIGNLTNIQGHECSIDKNDRQKLLNQKGFVTWITGLSGLGTYLLLFFLLDSFFSNFFGVHFSY